MVAVAPELVVVSHIHQGHADGKIIALLLQFSRDNGVDLQLSPKGWNVELFFFEASDRSERPNFEIFTPDLREAVDDLIGDAITEILGFRIAAKVFERQDGDRMNALFPRRCLGNP